MVFGRLAIFLPHRVLVVPPPRRSGREPARAELGGAGDQRDLAVGNRHRAQLAGLKARSKACFSRRRRIAPRSSVRSARARSKSLARVRGSPSAPMKIMLVERHVDERARRPGCTFTFALAPGAARLGVAARASESESLLNFGPSCRLFRDLRRCPEASRRRPRRCPSRCSLAHGDRGVRENGGRSISAGWRRLLMNLRLQVGLCSRPRWAQRSP